jgi:hypothetical protein
MRNKSKERGVGDIKILVEIFGNRGLHILPYQYKTWRNVIMLCLSKISSYETWKGEHRFIMSESKILTKILYLREKK